MVNVQSLKDILILLTALQNDLVKSFLVIM